MADSGLVWCHCHSLVRQGGMCSDQGGFCNPEILDDNTPDDEVLITAFLADPYFDLADKS